MPHPARQFLDAVELPNHGGDVFARLESAAQNAATSAYSRNHPTLAQRAASDYAMGEITIHGMPLRIENHRNTYREKADKGGKVWRSRMAAHYGDIDGTRGNDGDPIDVFVGPFPESTTVWVINQRRLGTDTLDEHKAMLGFVSEQQARGAYQDSYDRGWTGLMSIVRATVKQFKWWLQSGDKSRPFSADQLPLEGMNIMDKVLWNNDAEPVTTTLHRLMYDLRVNDGKAALLLDSVTMADLMGDPEIESVLTYDALVVEVNRMSVKMDMLKRVMEAAGGTVKPTEVTISDPVKARGVLQVMVLFQMSDGQTIAIWFHNPDTTPSKLMPLDDLISWKWMLNKKDVTIVVAPERGQELNIREVARRVMRLVERNSEAYQKANVKAGERAAESKALDDEIVTLEGELTGLQRQIEVAKVEKEDAAKAVTRKIAAVLAEQDRVFKLLEKEKEYGLGADTVKLEALMNQYDDLANEIRTLRGEAAAGRSSWATWKALRDAEEARKAPVVPESAPAPAEAEAATLKFNFPVVGTDAAGVWGAIVEVPTVDGEKVRVSQAQLESARTLLSMFTKDGKRKPGGGINRGNLLLGDESELSENAALANKLREAGFTVAKYPRSAEQRTKLSADGYLEYVMGDDGEPKLLPGLGVVWAKPAVTAEIESRDTSLVGSVDAAYQFADASDGFKVWVADSIESTDYSPFASAKAMDLKAKELGLKISWAVGMAVLDDAGTPVEDDSLPVFDDADSESDDDDFDENAEFDAAPEEDEDGEEVNSVMDGDFQGHPFRGNQFKAASSESGSAVRSSIKAKGAERRGDTKSASKAHQSAHYSHKAAAVSASGKAKSYHKKMAKFHGARAGVKVMDSVLDDAGETYEVVIGKIKQGVKIIGRAMIGGDGKAMVYLGSKGVERVKGPSGNPAMWSDDDAADLVGYLVANVGVPFAAEVPSLEQNREQAALAALMALGWKDEKNGFVSREIKGGYKGSVNPEGIRRIFARVTEGDIEAKFGDAVVATAHYMGPSDATDAAASLNSQIDALDVEASVKTTTEPAKGDTDVSRLNAAERAAPKGAITSDDPAAIEKLTAKLTALQTRQEFMKKANKSFKTGNDAGLLAMGFTQVQIDGLKKPDFAGRIGFADYLLTNNNSVISSTRKRLESMIKDQMNQPAVEALEPAERDPLDVATDPEGILVIEPDQPLVPAAVANPAKDADTAYLQSLVDGTTDMFAADIFERLEPMFTAYEADADMMALLTKAAEAYGESAVKAARAALATA